MRIKVIWWVVPVLFGAAILRSYFASADEPVQVAQAPSLFDGPAAADNAAPAPAADGDRPEAKSRHVQMMLDLLEETKEDATDEQVRDLREILLDADDELHRSMGENLEWTIRRFNNPRKTFSVGRPVRAQPYRERFGPLPPVVLPKTGQPTPAVKPAPAEPTDDPFQSGN